MAAGAGATPSPEAGLDRPRGLAFGVVILAAFQLALGAWWLAALAGAQIGAEPGMPAQLAAQGDAGRTAVAIFGAIRVIAALGLLLRLRSAWVLVMLLTGLGLATTIAGYFTGQPDDPRLLFEVVSAFYLNQPSVHAVFGARRPHATTRVVLASGQ